MGQYLINHPLIQSYLIIVAALAIAICWDRLRTPPAPEDESPVE